MTKENTPATQENRTVPPLSLSHGWAPCLDFYEHVCQRGIDRGIIRDMLPADLMRILVLLKMGWWIGHYWKVMRPDGTRGIATSFHGPKGEFQPHAPAEVLAMTRKQMVDFLFSREHRNN